MDIPRSPTTHGRLRRYWPLTMIGLAAMALVLIARVGPAAPGIARDRVVIDTAVRGDLVREVRGPGRLVPEQQFLIPAVASGRVDRRLVEPGARIDSGTLLLVMSNPEVDLQLLEAEQTLADTRLARQRLTATHQRDQLTARDALAVLRAEEREAARLERITAALADSQWVSRVDATNASERLSELRRRIASAERRIAVADSNAVTELVAQDEQIRRVERVATFHRQRVASLEVRADADGVVQEIPPELGEWIMAGTLVARVFQPGRLRAEVEVDEARAGEVAPGQPVTIGIRGDSIVGRVRRVRPAAAGGTVTVEVVLGDPLPVTARPDLNINAVIETGRLTDVIHLRRPASALAGRSITLYRLDGDDAATLVSLRVGEGSSERVAVLEGATAGDVFIVSDVSTARGAGRIRLRD